MTISDSIEAIDERFEDRKLERISLDIEFDSDGEGVTETSVADARDESDLLTRDEARELIDQVVKERLDKSADEIIDHLTTGVSETGNEAATDGAVGPEVLPELPDPSIESEPDSDESEAAGPSVASDGVPNIRDDLFIEVTYPNSSRSTNSTSPKRAYPILKMLYDEASPSDPVPVLAFEESVEFNVSALMPVLFGAGVVDRRKEYTAYSNRSNYCYWLTSKGVEWLDRVEEKIDHLPEPAEIEEP